MSLIPKDPTTSSGEEAPPSSSDPLQLALRQALAEPPRKPASLLPKIQERIYERTRGRYFRKKKGAWRDRMTLLLAIALLVLILIIAGFLSLSSQWESSAAPPDASSGAP